MIYFIQNLETLSIKIGYTGRDPKIRVRALQVGSTSPLRLIGYIPGDKEREHLVQNLAGGDDGRYRISGEWFMPTLDLAHFLYGLCLSWNSGYNRTKDFSLHHICNFTHLLCEIGLEDDGAIMIKAHSILERANWTVLLERFLT